MLDPAEVDFTFTTPAMFHDVESGSEIYIDPAAARGRLSAPVRRARRPRSSDRAWTWASNIDSITTDRPLELVLFDLLKARMSRGRRAGARVAPGRGGAR